MPMKKIFVCFMFVLFSSPVLTWADTHVAESCSSAHVQAAINLATGGDTYSLGDVVTIPAGECTWTEQVTLGTKNITLQGAGSGVGGTQITNTTTTTLYSEASPRITQISFVANSSVNGLAISGPSGFRIDHCKFTASSGKYSIFIWGSAANAKGLIDANEMNDALVIVFGDNSNQPRIINNTNDLNLGTDEAVYIENNTFTAVNSTNLGDGNQGAKVVYRYNTFSSPNYFLEAHSIQGDEVIASMKWEIYNNSFSGNHYAGWHSNIRGGTGVIYNNTTTGTGSCDWVVDNVRSYAFRGTAFGICNGSSSVDGNQTLYSGTHTGGSGAATLTDSTKSWDTNDFVVASANTGNSYSGSHTPASPAGDSATTLTDSAATFATAVGDDVRGLWLQNTSDGSGCVVTSVPSATSLTCSAGLSGGSDNTWTNGDTWVLTLGYTVTNTTSGAKGQIRANDGTTVTATLIGGSRQTWNTNDNYTISSGYPCRGQIGWGKDDDGWANFPNSPYPSQAQVPAYAWGNTCNGSASPIAVKNMGLNVKHIVEDRDFYNASSMADAKSKGLIAGYSPYTCPHPLTGLTGSCLSGTAGTGGYNVGGNIAVGAGGTITFGAGGTITLGN